MPDFLDPVLAGAGYVHARLVLRFGVGIEHVGVVDRGAYVWWVRRSGRPSFLIRFTRAALVAPKAQLDVWVDSLAEDARDAAPAAGGFYVVDVDGIKAMGMDDFEFEKHGQLVHLYIDLGPPRVWRMEVDATDRGVLMPAGPQDVRDDVARRAVEALTVSGHIRVPTPPWLWSVLDTQGREWWGRLDGDGAGRRLVLMEVGTNREHRLAWMEERPPGAAMLRQLVEAA